MATSSSDLLSSIRVEIGDVGGTGYTDAVILDTYFPAGLEAMKGKWPQQYTVDASTRNITPDPADDDYNDERVLVLFASIQVMKTELADARRKAIYHSDPAGATELRDRAKALAEAVKDLGLELGDLYFMRTRRLVEEEVEQGKEISRSDIAHQSSG
jgi:hypothetical protein